MVSGSVLTYVPAYFDTVITHAYKMFITLTPGANVIKLFTAVSYEFS